MLTFPVGDFYKGQLVAVVKLRGRKPPPGVEKIQGSRVEQDLQVRAGLLHHTRFVKPIHKTPKDVTSVIPQITLRGWHAY